MFLIIFFMLMGNAWGAELLIMARDCPSPDAYRKGDIVSVAEDGFYEKSTGYTLPDFLIVKMPGVKVEDVKTYEEPLTESVDRVIDGKTEVVSETVRLRKYNVAPSLIDSVKFTGKNDTTIASKDQATLVATKSLAVEKAEMANALVE